ncbi:hypothetical protein HPB51_028003 [Rhipicephalus microplus]|uniref:Glutamate receptor n=1 Tax=Rhipicephalus microplus TaxID=6941 RepID=A0A9J6CYK5_RHIMP|nr:hypothetical protein HPB51_028003 [Rhipicephalus microplus]
MDTVVGVRGQGTTQRELHGVRSWRRTGRSAIAALSLEMEGAQQNAPYVMLKKSAHKLEGNDRFEGYCVDLLHEISATLGFRYRLKLVRDGTYGTRDSQGRWNGIMRELVDMEADLAIGDLTITSEREQSVDFTMPFMTLGVSILYKKTDQKRFLLFFLSPLSGDVWLCVAGACVAVSVILCCVARAQSAVRRNSTLPTVQGDFTLPNSFWFIVSAITRQDCGIFPREASARIIAATWWIFSFLLVSSYTANLTASLTKERLLSPIESAEDLAKQSAVRYGCVRSGSTHALFKMVEEWATRDGACARVSCRMFEKRCERRGRRGRRTTRREYKMLRI